MDDRLLAVATSEHVEEDVVLSQVEVETAEQLDRLQEESAKKLRGNAYLFLTVNGRQVRKSDGLWVFCHNRSPVFSRG